MKSCVHVQGHLSLSFYLYPHSKFAAGVTLLAYPIETSIMILQTQKSRRSPIPCHLKLSFALTSVQFPSRMALALCSWHLHDATSLFLRCPRLHRLDRSPQS